MSYLWKAVFTGIHIFAGFPGVPPYINVAAKRYIIIVYEVICITDLIICDRVITPMKRNQA